VDVIVGFLNDLIIEVISQLGYLGIFFAMTLESACMPVPSEVVLPFSGYLVWLGLLDLFLVVLVSSSACLAGSLIAYYVGALGGRPFLIKYGKYLLISKKELDLADEWFSKYGDKIIFISRLLPVVRTFISLPAGIAKMEIKTFTLYTFLGSLPFCFLLTYIGVQLGPHWDNIIGFFDKIDLAIILILLAALALFLYKSRGKQKR